ncbi:MAG: DAK2 domain-containing protein [bacterium]
MGRRAADVVSVLSREQLRLCVIAGAERVIAHRELLNRINVFSVRYRDTGTNLAATIRAVIAGLRRPLPSPDAVSTTLAASAFPGAQGNSGVILAQFFRGLREGIGGGIHVTVDRFIVAMRHAALRARRALAQPHEGTILTVMSDVAEHLGARREKAHDFRALLDERLRAARTLADPLFVVSHSEAPALAQRYHDALRKRHPRAEIMIANAGPALGSQSGPGEATIATLDVALVDRAIANEQQESSS